MARQSLDITLRDLVQDVPPRFVELLSGRKGRRLLDTALPQVKDRRVDLLVELEDGAIFHLELQGTNHPRMAHRMLEYRVLLMERYRGRPIHQTVLYVGTEPLRMADRLEEGGLSFRYHLLDIRDIRCEELLISEDLTDRILAVLCRVEDPEGYFRRILQDLGALSPRRRRDYLLKLFNLLSYRPLLAETFNREVKKMPLTIDVELMKKHPFYFSGMEEGIALGMVEDAQEMVLEALEARFGPVDGEIRSQMESITDRRRLKELLRLVVTAPDLDAFLKELRQVH